MPERRCEKATKLDQNGMAVEFVGLKDESAKAEERTARIQNAVTQMVLLGKKKGRPRKEETADEDAA